MKMSSYYSHAPNQRQRRYGATPGDVLPQHGPHSACLAGFEAQHMLPVIAIVIAIVVVVVSVS